MYRTTLLEFLNMGGSEIMLILGVVLLLFGGKKLPELARGLGKGIREFKDASDGVKREIHRNINAMDIDEEREKMDAYQHNHIEEPAPTPHIDLGKTEDTPISAPETVEHQTINLDKK